MHHRRGRLPARFGRGSMRFALAMASVIDPLGPAPDACNNYLAAMDETPCPMFLNDQLGDCVCADTGHTLMVRTANASRLVTPSDDDIRKLYEVFGYRPGDSNTDNGVCEVDMCAYLKSTGFLGHKLDDWATLEVTGHNGLNHLRWANILCGTVRLGFNLPGYADDQFDANQPRDVQTTGDQSTGGHDVPLVDYRGGLFYVTTWGRWRQPVTPAFMLKYCEEAHPELSYDWIRSTGTAPSGLSLDVLDQRMKEASA